jgi:hypothetical protein
MHTYYIKATKAGSKVANSRYKQKLARFKAGKGQRPKRKHNPRPKLPPLPIKLGGLAKVQLGYAHQIWHIQSNMYINTVLTINAYITSTLPNGMVRCYVPACRTKPAYSILVHGTLGSFTAGIQQFYIIKYLPTKG